MSKKRKLKTTTKVIKTNNYKKKTKDNAKRSAINSDLKNARKDHFNSTKTGKAVNAAKGGVQNVAKNAGKTAKSAKDNFKNRRDSNRQFKRDKEKSLAVSNLGIAAIAADTLKDLSKDIKESEDRSEQTIDQVMGQGK